MSMSRVIKFRAWGIDRGRMHDVYNIAFHESYGYKAITSEQPLDLHSTFTTKEEFILMQYTGLKDKNGVEIFEGDIVERMYIFKGEYGETHTGEVVYDKEYARYVISRPKKHIEPKTEDLRNTLSDKCTYEVLGNVYENPELLEVES